MSSVELGSVIALLYLFQNDILSPICNGQPETLADIHIFMIIYIL